MTSYTKQKPDRYERTKTKRKDMGKEYFILGALADLAKPIHARQTYRIARSISIMWNEEI